MNKIGLLTYCKDNYGSVLQCYSTINYLSKNGYRCDYVVEKESKNLFLSIQRYFRLLIKSFRYPNFFKDKLENKKTTKISNSVLDPVSKRKIDYFIQSNISMREYTYKELKEIAKTEEYSYFITGSDQVWNPTLGLKKSYYLQFAPKNKRISLAPSFGVSNIPNYYKKELRNYIAEIPYLSVREEEGKEIIMGLTNRNAKRICDPVVLTSKSDWVKFASESQIKETKYIFVHFLNEINEKAIIDINEYASKYNLKIVTFAYHQPSFSKLVDLKFINGGPQDYVNLINRAAYVFTDSFHTTMFSIILNTNFYTYERAYTHSNSQQSRIVNLLKRYSLIDRFITNENTIREESIEYNSVNKIVINERNAAIDYLKTALHMSEEERL